MIGLLSGLVGVAFSFIWTMLLTVIGVYDQDNEGWSLFIILLSNAIIFAIFYVVVSIAIYGVIL